MKRVSRGPYAIECVLLQGVALEGGSVYMVALIQRIGVLEILLLNVSPVFQWIRFAAQLFRQRP